MLGLIFAIAFPSALIGSIRWIPVTLTTTEGSLLGSLSGATIGLIAVAISAAIGFENLRQDRYAKRTEESIVLKAGLSGECKVISWVLKNWADVISNRVTTHLSSQARDDLELPILFNELPSISTCLYENNAGKIGTLGASEAQELTWCYGRAFAWNGLSQKSNDAVSRPPEVWNESAVILANLSNSFERLGNDLRNSEKSDKSA